MTRKVYRTPGYDCRNGRCQHPRKGDHGISGGIYTWVVTDTSAPGRVAGVLWCFASEFPDTVSPEVRNRRVEVIIGGASVHVDFPVDRDDVRNPAGTPCVYLDGVPCYLAVDSTLAPEEVFRTVLVRDAYNAPVYEQPETFWLVLEAWTAKHAERLRANRADKRWRRCDCCNGNGTVEVA